ncbi:MULTISPECIES: DMT family transporter [unclassified Caballeronia]|uniref:DMT family transporter n=1 Tax=unclassified Caballeronia TaxID=2646786 RepID=UPI00202791EE|nr:MULTISPECIES: DMT family transporter [unclassified Caballeronia]MDR5766470.1 DMT family transporter [Caballeronia sp. LZ028]
MAQAPHIGRKEDRSTHNERRWLATGGPILFLLLWSAGFPIAKTGLHYASPLTFLAIRFALSVGVLLAVCAVKRPQWPRNARAWLHLGVVGFLVQVMYFGLSYLSMTAGIATSVLALIVSLQPILVGVLAPKFVGERIGVRRWIGLLLGLAGAAGVIVARGPLHAESLGPVLMAIGALVGITAAMLYEKRLGTAQDPVTSNLVQYSVGFVFCAPMALLFEHTQVQWTPAFIATLAYLVVGNSLIAITLLLAMTRAGKVSQVASLFFFVPPAAAVLSYFFLDEVLPRTAWYAMGVAVLGVAIATWKPRR